MLILEQSSYAGLLENEKYFISYKILKKKVSFLR